MYSIYTFSGDLIYIVLYIDIDLKIIAIQFFPISPSTTLMWSLLFTWMIKVWISIDYY